MLHCSVSTALSAAHAGQAMQCLAESNLRISQHKYVQVSVEKKNSKPGLWTVFKLNHLLAVQAESTSTSEEPVFHQLFFSGLGVTHGVDIADGGHGGELTGWNLLPGCYEQVSPKKLNIATWHTGMAEYRTKKVNANSKRLRQKCS